MTKTEEPVLHADDGHWTSAPGGDTLTPLIWQDPSLLEDGGLELLAYLATCSKLELSERLLNNQYQLFRCGTLIVLAGKLLDGTLMLLAVVQTGNKGAHYRSLVQQLKRLGKDWGCHRIVTSTKDARVGKLLRLLGSKTIEVTLELEI